MEYYEILNKYNSHSRTESAHKPKECGTRHKRAGPCQAKHASFTSQLWMSVLGFFVVLFVSRDLGVLRLLSVNCSVTSPHHKVKQDQLLLRCFQKLLHKCWLWLQWEECFTWWIYVQWHWECREKRHNIIVMSLKKSWNRDQKYRTEMRHVIVTLWDKHSSLLGRCLSIVWWWLPTSLTISGEEESLNNAYQPSHAAE